MMTETPTYAELESMLAGAGVTGNHLETHEAYAGYTTDKHDGYGVSICAACGEPTIQARYLHPKRITCGRWACMGAVGEPLQ